jgi:glycosyltransferase involved in cell wall biosynthesis
MDLRQITPLILTFNEAANIGRTLAKAKWANDIVVVDSLSTDPTVEIAQSFPRVRMVQRKFDDHSSQWNFGIDQVSTEWVLALDADYRLSDEFVSELDSLDPQPEFDAFFASFVYCVQGRVLRGTLYPRRAVLFRKARCRFVQDGHTQMLSIPGKTGQLASVIYHDDRKPLERWLTEQGKYARLEAAKLLAASPGELNFTDRLRKQIVLAPPGVLFYTLFVEGLILDGWPGWLYVLQRTLAEMLLSMKLIETRLNGTTKDS